MAGKVLKSVQNTAKADTSPKASAESVLAFSEDEDLAAVRAQLEKEDGLTSDNVTYVTTEQNESLHESETTNGLKTLQTGVFNEKDSDGTEFDSPDANEKEQKEEIGGTVDETKKGLLKYKGELGEFTYDPEEWSIGQKEVSGKNGETSTIPILKYIGKETDGDKIEIPDGVKSLDYTFEGNTKIESVPDIPISVTSAHAAFANCTSLMRGCKKAKDNEYHQLSQGTVNAATVGGGVAGAGTIIGGCALAGSSVPVIGTLIGAGVGAVAAGGIALYNRHKGEGKDGLGGEWYVPDGLEDTSYMFAGCTKLEETYTAGGENLKNAEHMYDDTAIGLNKDANELGSSDKQDISDTLLTDETTEAMYENTNNQVLYDEDGNLLLDEKYQHSNRVDAEGNAVSKDVSKADEASVKEVNTLATEKHESDGIEHTELYEATSGKASQTWMKDEDGNVATVTEPTATTVEQSEAKGNDGEVDNGNSLLGFLDRGAISIGEYWILKKLTGSTLISGIATFGLQAVGVLPKSMKPVLTTVAGFVGEDSAVGKVLTGFADKLPEQSGSIFGSKKDTQGENVVTDESDRVSSDMSAVSTAATTQNQEKAASDITAQMRNNGTLIARDGVLLTAGGKNGMDAEFQDMQTMGKTMAAGMEQKAVNMAGESGKLSDEDKQALSDQFVAIMKGMTAYSDGAMTELQKQYGSDSAKLSQATSGLEKTMQASAAPMMDTMKELDEKYDFLTDEVKTILNQLQVQGLPSYDQYQAGSYDTLSNQSSQQVEIVGQSDEEMAMYANAGLNDELLSTSNTDAKQSSATQGSTIETRQQKQTSKQTSNRGAMAEAAFGDIAKQSETVSELDF